MGPEAKLEKKMREAVIAAGGLFVKQQGSAGMPDRLIILPGPTYLFVELKAKHGRLSKMQQLRIQQLQDLGCLVCVAQGSRDVEEMCAIILDMSRQMQAIRKEVMA